MTTRVDFFRSCNKVVSESRVDMSSSACWWDCHPLEKVYYPAVMSYVKPVFRLQGAFCSWSCAYSWSRSQGLATGNLLLYRKRVTGVPIISLIEPAPPREALQLFGGPLTIESFREYCSSRSKSQVHSITAPSTWLVPSIIETKCVERGPNEVLDISFLSNDPSVCTVSNRKRDKESGKRTRGNLSTKRVNLGRKKTISPEPAPEENTSAGTSQMPIDFENTFYTPFGA